MLLSAARRLRVLIEMLALGMIVPWEKLRSVQRVPGILLFSSYSNPCFCTSTHI